MAHNFESKTLRVWYNSDYSGTVTLVCKTIADAGLQFEVDFEDIKAFMAEYVRSELINRCEQATPNQLLFGGVDI